jgi:hypothetical protein
LTSLAVLDLPAGSASSEGQDGSGADAPDTENLIPLVNQLMSLLEGCDTKAQEIVKDEGSLFTAAGFGPAMDTISQALDDYDFDAALSELQEVARQIDQ